MEDLPRIIGDGLSIAALAIIFGLSYSLQQKVPADRTIPVYFQRSGEPGPKASKAIGLWTGPMVSMIVLFLPSLAGLTYDATGQEAVMLVCLRAIVAAALALRHLVFIRAVTEMLQREDDLLP